jgi:hypothetical protein
MGDEVVTVTNGAAGLASGAQGATTGGDATGTAAALNPAMEARLSAEAAKRRVENNALKEQIADLTAQLQAFAKPAPTTNTGNGAKPSPSPDDLAAMLSETNAKLREALDRQKVMEDKMTETTKAAMKKMLRANLTRTLAEAKVLDVDAATLLLEARGARLTEDDRVVIDIKTETGDDETVMLNSEALRKHQILKDHFFSPVGVGGAGSAAPRTAPIGLDLERAKTDPKYYAENRDKILAHQRANR